jgi:hypothetical protein
MSQPGIDHTMRGVGVVEYRAALIAAAGSVANVEPPGLREPLSLWFRAEAERAAAWTSLLGRSVVSCWNAARAVLDAPALIDGSDAQGGDRG